MSASIRYSVFTKPWKALSTEQLGEWLKQIGVDAIEFPLREGYQVDMTDMEKGLYRLVHQLHGYGIEVASVASTLDEGVFSACAEAGVPVIRIMANVDIKKGYWVWEKEMKQQLLQTVPLCEKYKVQVGIQHHYGMMISNAMELFHLVKDFDPAHIGAVWDAGHSGLAGDEMEKGLHILWSHLCMVNFKNAYYQRQLNPVSGLFEWKRNFSPGSQGLASWPEAVQFLKEKNYSGVVCLTAEYTQEDRVDEFITEDLRYIKALFKGED